MKKAFEPASLAGIRLNNRILRAATHEGMGGENGIPIEELKKKYLALARGGVGGIITGYMGISQQGKSPLYHMTMIDRDECIAPWADVVDSVHKENTPIIAEIAHCGGDTTKEATGHTPVAPSKLGKARALTEAEIWQIISDFAAAILRVKKAGFDAVELHAGHGYLLSEFLSPRTNKRTDAWGGDTERRFRIVREIISAARAQVGDFPILVKLNATERSRNGMTLDEAIKLAKLLEDAGCNGIEVSCGMASEGLYTIRGNTPWQMLIHESASLSKLPAPLQSAIGFGAKIAVKSAEPRKLFNVPAAAAIHRAVQIPVIVVGGIDNLPAIEAILASDEADFVSMSRPFILEPNLVSKFQNGQQTQAKCINCNYCLMAHQPLRCYYGKVPSSDKASMKAHKEGGLS